MRLCILNCILFLIGLIDASGKIKTTENGTQIGNSHHRIEKMWDCYGSEVVIEKEYCAPKLPYGGAIVDSKGEYIPGTKSD